MSNMRKIRIGMIGVGQIGKSHLENYAKIPDAEIVAICDINEAELSRLAQKYEIPHTYTDYTKLLERDDLDGVDVCMHNNYHSTISIAAMKAGKNVYCEKPIAGTFIDGKSMVEAAKQFDKKLHIQLATLYRKETKAAKALIDGGQLGRLYHARSTGYRRRNRPYVDGYGTAHFTRKETAAGGALLDMGIYHISQMLYLLGLPKAQRISGKVYQEMDMDAERRNNSGFNVEELALGFVKFEGGLSLDIIESWAVHMKEFEGSSIFGSKGGIRLPGYTPNDTFSFHTTQCDMDLDSTLDLNLMDIRWHRLRENEDAYDSSQHHWIAVLQGRVELLPTAELALQTMLISEGIYHSETLGREVTTDEVESWSKSQAISLQQVK